MTPIVIRADGLGKRYRLGRRLTHTTVRDALGRLAGSPGRAIDALRRRPRPPEPGEGDEVLWALRDVSFEVERGEILGIIGRNGAGKSTLLKVLSRITEPTTGLVDLYGRVGALLEVGTGFHPELSGRENVYLNGAILGMTRAEIARSLDAILAFAEVERFADTPVKRYSSGMYLRLAFAVAAHLRPEILIVDEVLAVGDAQFQAKCLRKMQEVSHNGRTVLFVSHNLAAVRHICRRGMALDGGRVVEHGEINQVVDAYLSHAMGGEDPGVAETGLFVVEGVDVAGAGGRVIKPFDDVTISVRLRAKRSVRDPGVYVGLLTLDHQRLAGLDFKDFSTAQPLEAGDRLEVRFEIQALPLLAGAYRLEVHVKDLAEHVFELVGRTYAFDVAESPVYGGRKLDQWFGSVGLRARACARAESGSMAAAAPRPR